MFRTPPDAASEQNRGMPPITPPTLTRIDPAFPLLWRDTDTVQFGLDSALRVALSEPWIEPLLQIMRTGFRRSAFDVVAHGVGAPRDAARALLERLKPVLRTDRVSMPPVWIESVNLADSRVALRFEQALLDEGFQTAARGTAGAVGIVLVHGAASAHHLARYLHDDLAHLPVAFEPGGTVIGPLIVPGRTPCLSCREQAERDRDPAWPSLHAQLIGATGTRITAARTAEASGLVAQLLSDTVASHDPRAVSPARSVRVTPDGERVWHEARFHEECLCREPSCLSLPGSARADAPRVPKNATTTAPVSALRA